MALNGGFIFILHSYLSNSNRGCALSCVVLVMCMVNLEFSSRTTFEVFEKILRRNKFTTLWMSHRKIVGRFSRTSASCHGNIIWGAEQTLKTFELLTLSKQLARTTLRIISHRQLRRLRHSRSIQISLSIGRQNCKC